MGRAIRTAAGCYRNFQATCQIVPSGGDKIRPIDHLVLPATTLTLVRARLTSLGFTVAPDARHSFGTGNCCVFFKNRTYLEPITIIDRNRADMAAAEGIAFVKRLKRFTERQGEGFAMVAVKSKDAEADLAALTKAAAASQPAFHFSRQALLPDGSEREIGFVLAFADFSTAPDATFFVCQHLAEEVLYQPSYVEHSNGAEGINAVVAVAEDPADFQAMLKVATGNSTITTIDAGVKAEADGQGFLILTREGFRARYDIEPPNPRRGLRFAAFEMSVLDLDRAARYAGSSAKRHEDRIVVPAAPGLGAVVAFRRVASE
jgi:hypothetical protein